MTQQITDTFRMQGKEFSLVAFTSPVLFRPQDYGLEPHPILTACWKGYWCEYNISDRKFLLQNLFIHMEGENYPPFNGVEISHVEYEKVNVYSVAKGWRTEMTAKYMGHRVYKDVNLPIPYTGKLLLGDEFLAEYFAYLGNQKSWAYNVLLELILVNGVVVEANDYSDEAKKQRERVDVHRRKNPLEFRQDSFSLDYNDKAW